jgi:hypothetical protein
MHCGHFTTFSGGNDVSMLSSSDVNGSDVILMDWPLREIFICVFVFFTSTEESLLSCFQILNNTEGSSRKHDLVVILTEVKTSFVSISSETINMIDFVSTVWFTKLRWILNSSGWRLFSDLLQEELFLWRFFSVSHAINFWFL